MIVAFLQNAWSPVYAGGTWPRESWLRALHQSRSGQRISILADAVKPTEIWWDNTTPIVGEHPSSVVEPDSDHIDSVLDAREPTAVIALGKQAAAALRGPCDVRKIPLLILPHPAHRVLTNSLYERAGRVLNRGWHGAYELKQSFGKIEVVK